MKSIDKISAEVLFHRSKGKCTVTDLVTNGKLNCHHFGTNTTFLCQPDQLFFADIFNQKHCYYCQMEFKNDSTRDHIIPSSKRGTGHELNICYSCKKCNGHKGNMTPQELLDFINSPEYKKPGTGFGFNRSKIVPRIQNLIIHTKANLIFMQN